MLHIKKKIVITRYPCDLIWYLHVQWKDSLDFDIGEEALHATFER